MSKAAAAAPGRVKPKVAIVYSEGTGSLESRSFAQWVGASLADTGYATAILVGWDSEKPFEAPAHKRIKYYPIGKTKAQEAPVSDCFFGSISSIAEVK